MAIVGKYLHEQQKTPRILLRFFCGPGLHGQHLAIDIQSYRQLSHQANVGCIIGATFPFYGHFFDDLSHLGERRRQSLQPLVRLWGLDSMYVCLYLGMSACMSVSLHVCVSGEPHASSIPNVMNSLYFCSRSSIFFGCAASNCLSAHKFTTANCCKCIAEVKMRLQSLTNQNVHSPTNAHPGLSLGEIGKA